jgi:hypothetical protein
LRAQPRFGETFDGVDEFRDGRVQSRHEGFVCPREARRVTSSFSKHRIISLDSSYDRDVADQVADGSNGGYGKTTLLAAWSRARAHAGPAVARYALDSSDNDSIPFGSYLVA